MRNEINSNMKHQKALLFAVGGLFLRCCDSSVGARRQLLGLSPNRLASDRLVKALGLLEGER